MTKDLLKQILYYGALVLTAPLAFVFKLSRSRDIFAGQSQLLALVPGKIGSYVRVAYYCWTLKRCTSEAYIGFGTFFAHPEAELGKGCYIGSYCIIGMARIGDHATIGSGVHILSGKHQHGYGEIGTPIQKQKGTFKTIEIGKNCWIGNGAIVMESLGIQNVIAAGSVVVHETMDYEVHAGNPARLLKRINSVPTFTSRSITE